MPDQLTALERELLKYTESLHRDLSAKVKDDDALLRKLTELSRSLSDYETDQRRLLEGLETRLSALESRLRVG